MKKTVVGLILLYLFLYLLPLGGRSLVTPDEMRYGEIAREMNVSGDYIVPRLNGLRYFEKPVLGHVLNAGSMRVFGETHFGVRFASAASVGLAAWALFLLVLHKRDERTAALATLIYLTSVMVQGIGTFSTLDSMVSGFITLCLCAFYAAATEPSAGRRAGYLVGVGIFAGCAFLVKGFLAFAVPVLVIVPFLLWQKQWKRLFTLPWIPILGILATALPWCIMIALREADFWNYFFWEEHIHRFTAKGEAQHSEPIWFFIPVLIIGAMPWALLSPMALFRPIKERLGEPLVRYALIWLLAPFLFFSLSSGKLPTYILPCFPALAILLSIGLLELFDRQRDKPVRVGMWIFFSLTAIAFIGLVLTGLLPIEEAKIYREGELGKFFIVIATLGTSAVLYWVAIKRVSREWRLPMFGIATAVLMVGMQFGVPSRGSVSSGIEAFLLSNEIHLPENAILAGDSRTVHALCFIFKRDDIYLLRSKGELDYGLAYPEAAGRYLDDDDFVQLMETRGRRPVVVVGRKKRLGILKEYESESIYVDSFRYLTFTVFPALEN